MLSRRHDPTVEPPALIDACPIPTEQLPMTPRPMIPDLKLAAHRDSPVPTPAAAQNVVGLSIKTTTGTQCKCCKYGI